MGIPKCCVPGCADSVSTRHRFPSPTTDATRYEKWLKLTANSAFFAAIDPQTIYANKRVCHRHFESKYFTPGLKSHRLHKNALPTLYLPGPDFCISPCVPSILEELSTSQNATDPTPSTSAIETTLDPRSAMGAEVNNPSLSPKPSTSWNMLTEHSYCAPPLWTTSQTPCPTVLAQGSLADKTIGTSERTGCKRPASTLRKGSTPTPHHLVKMAGISPMTPRKRVLYGHVKRFYRRLNQMKISKESFKRRLIAAEKFGEDRNLEANLNSLNAVAATFIRCQFREANKSPTLRRFVPDEKVLALTLYNKGPKLYKFLSKMFVLPSKSTLKRFLDEIDFSAGINEKIFDSLKRATQNYSERDKFVSVIFDEMAIKPSLHFSESKGYIEGFGDMGNGDRSQDIADHMLMFLVRGVTIAFKQPVAYAFAVRGGAKALQIKRILLEIISRLIRIGLKPVATICDQAPTNVSLINSLINDTKERYARQGKEYRGDYFEVQSRKIFPLYDPPHLLKGMRNNFVNKSLKFKSGGVQKVAKWAHIQNLYEKDIASSTVDGLRALHGLTDEHIYAHKLKKMSVKHASQVFSYRLAATMKLAASLDSQGQLGTNIIHTAEILHFFDQLFDSVNGSECDPRTKGSKPLRREISDETSHISFWRETALPVLSSMEFEKNEKNDVVKPPSLKNWCFTIRNFIDLWQHLKKEGLSYILGRHFNQDPIENMFGQIRSHGILNTNPTATSFVGIFKSVVVNSTLHMYQPTFNCENDQCTMAFQGLRYYLTTNSNEATKPSSSSSSYSSGHGKRMIAKPQTKAELIASEKQKKDKLVQELADLANNYVAGFVLRRMKKLIVGCSQCKEDLFLSDDFNNPNNRLIKAREYGGAWLRRLCDPTVSFAQCFNELNKIINCTLKDACERIDLLPDLKMHVRQTVDFQFITCSVHEEQVINQFIKLSVRTLLHAWCKHINRILDGKYCKSYDGDNQVMRRAFEIQRSKAKNKQ